MQQTSTRPECARSLRARVTLYARCCGLLRLRAPAFDHVDAKPPFPAHAKAGNLLRTHQAINGGRETLEDGTMCRRRETYRDQLRPYRIDLSYSKQNN